MISSLEVASATLVRISYNDVTEITTITSVMSLCVKIVLNKLTIDINPKTACGTAPSLERCKCILSYMRTLEPCEACNMCPKCGCVPTQDESKNEYKTEWTFTNMKPSFVFIALHGSANVLLQHDLLSRNREVTLSMNDSSSLRLQDKSSVDLKQHLSYSLPKCNFLVRTIVLNMSGSASIDGCGLWVKALRLNANTQNTLKDFRVLEEMDVYTKGTPTIQVSTAEKCDVNKAYGASFTMHRIPNPTFTSEAVVMTNLDFEPVTKKAKTQDVKPPAYDAN